MEKNYTFKAFISYNHLDIKEAKWLQNKIESYRFPKDVIQVHPELSDVNQKICRDQTDLNGGVLTDRLREALDDSEYLIIICSPHSAQSQYCGEEIRYFIEQGRYKNIIPFIIDGEVNSQNQERECYHKVLLEEDKRNAGLLASNIQELGQTNAFIRVITTLYGLPFDTLIQREERRIKRNTAIRWSLVSTAMLVVLSFLAVALYQNSEINNSYRDILLSESRLLTEKAQNSLDEGDTISGIEYLLQALPGEGQDRPVLPEAQYLLTEALGIYQGNDSAFGEYSITKKQKDISSEVNEFFTTGDKNYLVTLRNNSLDVWKANSLRLYRNIKIENTSNLETAFTLSEHDIITHSDNTVYLYNCENGEKEWSIRIGQTIQKLILLEEQEKAYILTNDTCYVISTKNGKGIFSVGLTYDKRFQYSDIYPAKISENGEYLVYSLVDSLTGAERLMLNDLYNQSIIVIEESNASETGMKISVSKVDFDECYVYYCKEIEDNGVLMKSLYYYEINQEKKEQPVQLKNNNLKSLKDIDHGIVFYHDTDCYVIDTDDKTIVEHYIFKSQIKEGLVSDKSFVIVTENGELTYLSLRDGIYYKNILPVYVKDIGDIDNKKTYVLTEKNELVFCEYKINKNNLKKYADVDYLVSDNTYFIENGYHISVHDDHIYVKQKDEPEFVELPLNADGKEYFLSIEAIADDILVCSLTFIDSNKNKIIWYDLKTQNMTEKQVDNLYKYWPRVYVAEKDEFICLTQIDKKGQIVVLDCKEDSEDSFIFGPYVSANNFSVDSQGKYAVAIDSERAEAILIDIQSQSLVKVIPLSLWNRDSIRGLGRDQTIVWSNNGEFLAFSNQSNVFIYDHNGTLLCSIPYVNKNDDNKLPILFFSEDDSELYILNGFQLMQCDCSNGICLNELTLPEETLSFYYKADFWFDQDSLYLQYGGNMYVVAIDPITFGLRTIVRECVAFDPIEKRFFLSDLNYDTNKYEIDYYDMVSLEEMIQYGNELWEEETPVKEENIQIEEKRKLDSNIFILRDLSDVTVEESEHNYDIFQKRMNHYFQKEDYTMEKNSNYLLLTFPGTKYNNEDFQNILRELFTEPMNWSLGTDLLGDSLFTEPAYRQSGTDDQNGALMSINPEDIESVEYGMDENGFYFEFQFSEAIQTFMEEFYENHQRYPVLLDYNRYPGYRSRTYIWQYGLMKSDNCRYRFYYGENNHIRGYEEAICYNLTHEKMTKPYNVYEKKEIVWENDPAVFGGFQCEWEAIPDDSYCIYYSSSDSFTFDERINVEAALKSRLDGFCEKYAFGVTSDGFAVQIEGEHFRPDLFESITVDATFILQCGEKEILGNLTLNDSPSFDWNYDQTALQVMLPEKTYHDIQSWDYETPQTIYLDFLSKYNTIASIELIEPLTTPVITMTNLMIDPEKTWIKDVITAFIWNPEIDSYLSFDYYQHGDSYM